MTSQTNRRTRLHRELITWFDANARDLPWRGAVSPWAVMVSEFMLQQTPVVRVLPVFTLWMERWPTAAALASEPAGEAVRAWGRLGYPRRALRLHGAAVTIVDRFGGDVPHSLEDLRSLPGVGEYTAAAISSFAFSRSHAVLDTNVRRVLARLESGTRYPPLSLSAGERRRGQELLPDHDPARWSAALMELGAIVCKAQRPLCDVCPVRLECRWRLAGYPADGPPARRKQSYTGTDRQCRGTLLQALRDSPVPLERITLDQAWDKPVQRVRALNGLVLDGLVEVIEGDRFALTGTHPAR